MAHHHTSSAKDAFIRIESKVRVAIINWLAFIDPGKDWRPQFKMVESGYLLQFATAIFRAPAAFKLVIAQE
jgi:hypothetical protein